MTDKELIDNYFQQMHQVVDDISRPDIQKAIDILFTAWKNQKKVLIMGNGGSASSATTGQRPNWRTLTVFRFCCRSSNCTCTARGRTTRPTTPWART